MKRYPTLLAGLVFMAASSLTLVAGVTFAGVIGEWTNSGLLGICGPYGPHADLVGCIFLGSAPASLVVGIYSARHCYRHLRDGMTSHHTHSEPGHRTPVAIHTSRGPGR